MKSLAALLVLMSVSVAVTASETIPTIDEDAFFADFGSEFVPVNRWHTSYLVVDSVDSSTIYAMSPDGTVKMYRPYAVDANVSECDTTEKRVGFWCVSSGKLYRYRKHVAVECGGRPSSCGRFYINARGKICAFPNKDFGYEGQCEDKGRSNALDYFKTYPRK
jgi:hypothetical protein